MHHRQHTKQYPRWFILCGLLALLVLLAACGEDNNTKKTDSTTPDAQQLIKDAQTTMEQVKSYHFKLSTDNPGTATGNNITIQSADGDVVAPDKMKGKATAAALGAIFQTQVIAIGNDQYYTDPLSGKWTQTSDILDTQALADPHMGIANILGHLESLSTPTDSNVDGAACWSIDGKIDAQYIAGLVGEQAQPGKKVNTTVCVGKTDKHTYLIRANGAAFQGDKNNTIRTLKLSKFDESITITAPETK